MIKSIMYTAVPILASLETSATVRFYVETLGFTCRHESPGEYAIVQRDTIEIPFWACGDKRIAENTACRVGVTAIEALYDEYQSHGIIHPNAPLHDTEWSTPEFAILDLHGNLITFFERKPHAA